MVDIKLNPEQRGVRTPTLNIVPGGGPARSGIVNLQPPSFPPQADPKTNVEQEQKKRDLGRYFNLPPEAVEENFDELDRQKMDQEKEALVPPGSATAQALRQFPEASQKLEQVSLWDQMTQGFDQGRMTSIVGMMGHDLRNDPNNPFLQQRIDEYQRRISELEGTEEFWAADAAEIVGQLTEQFTDEDLALFAGGGAAVGGIAGLLLAPFTGGQSLWAAPVAGAKGGVALGATTQMAIRSYKEFGGHLYLDLKSEGVSHETADFYSRVAGMMGAALELGGMAAVLKPVHTVGKNVFRDQVRDAFRDKAFRAAALQFSKDYGVAVSGEVGTEVLQEFVNIWAEEWAKGEDNVGEEITGEEIGERIKETAIKTFRAMALLGIAGGVASGTSEAISIKRAQVSRDKAKAAIANKQYQDLAKTAPDVAAKVLDINLQNQGVDAMSIDGKAFLAWAMEQDNTETILSEAGIDNNTLNLIGKVDMEVEIDPQQFVKLSTMPGFDNLMDDLRMRSEGMTAREADALQAETPEQKVERAEAYVEERSKTGKPEVDKPINQAKHFLGIRAMFDELEASGMTPAEWATYQDNKMKVAQEAAAQRELKILDQMKRDQDATVKSLKAMVTPEEITNLITTTKSYQWQERLRTSEMVVDQAELKAALNEQGRTLRDVKSFQKYKLYGKDGMPLQQLAEESGYDSTESFLNDYLGTPEFNIAVNEAVESRIDREFGDIIKNEEAAYQDAKTDVINSATANLFYAEYKALQEQLKNKALSKKVFKDDAKASVGAITIKDGHPNRYLKGFQKLNNQLKKAIKDGDTTAAADLAYTRELKMAQTMELNRRWKKAFTRTRTLKSYVASMEQVQKMPIEYQQRLLSLYRDHNLATPLKERFVRSVMSQPSADGNVHVDPESARKGKRDYRDMTFDEFDTFYEEATAIRKQGVDAQKILKEGVKESVDSRSADVAKTIRDTGNVPEGAQSAMDTKTSWQETKAFLEDGVAFLIHADNIARVLDGFAEQGTVYQYIVKPYRDAMMSGYNPDQMGVIPRQNEAAGRLVKLYDRFTASEMRQISGNAREIPGVRQKLNRNQMITTALYAGSVEGYTNLQQNNGFTKDEIALIIGQLTQKELDLVEAMWEELGSYKADITEASRRRTNVSPTFTTDRTYTVGNRTMKGGLYPVRFDQKKAGYNAFEIESVEQAAEQQLMNNVTRPVTKKAHTTGIDSTGKTVSGKPLLLDLYSAHSFVMNSIYDLEAGDAINDVGKVLFNPQVQDALNEAGYSHYNEQLKLWFRDIAVGEQPVSGFLEGSLRFIRSKFVLSRMGLNVGVAFLQPLGLLQAAAGLGKGRIALEAMQSPVMFLKQAKFAINSSPLMKIRMDTFHRDIVDSMTMVHRSVTSRVVPRKWEQVAKDAAFYMIKRAQMYTDIVTWNAAYKKGMKIHQENRQAAIDYADDWVVRTQASGIFGDRSPLERGSWSAKHGQSEWARALTTFASYFLRKNAIAIEKFRRTNFLNPYQAINWAADMMLLYLIESLIISFVIPGGAAGPEDTDPEDLAAYAGERVLENMAAGVPGLREAVGATKGFATGGPLGNLNTDVGNALQQWGEAEFDEAFWRENMDLFGSLTGLPTAQAKKALRAWQEDGEWYEYFFGVEFEE